MTMSDRNMTEVRPARPSRDGDGVAIQRVVGMQHARMDPFLMLDELRSAYREDFEGGFPPHPHRGMQTLTYMLHGGLEHRDSRGHRGAIREGGLQWMSAGSGIIHSEMPTQDSSGLHGFQLWINLPASEKMSAPRYRDIPATDLPVMTLPDAQAVPLAGEWQLEGAAVKGPLLELADRAAVLDLCLAANTSQTLLLAHDSSLLAYVFEGSLLAQTGEIEAQNLVVTGPGTRWVVRAGQRGARVLLLRGQPIGEPVAHYGPFVMNSQQEIEQAILDYQQGRMG